ncbi:hypothetical protein GOBAR_AA34213 [Gossypium barbadense]|uniref:Uncharacterized protein n=1 Tax=Gossypium barbadense TaxID=3634 RepID=A0A2P5W5W6_GOSBA|nr:hypothetical protein GOBAR_AA34213 [Gossypium barbadense]
MARTLASGDQPLDKDNCDNGRLARKRRLLTDIILTYTHTASMLSHADPSPQSDLQPVQKSPELRVEFITSSQEARIAQQSIAKVIPQHTSSSCAPPSIRVELHPALLRWCPYSVGQGL